MREKATKRIFFILFFIASILISYYLVNSKMPQLVKVEGSKKLHSFPLDKVNEVNKFSKKNKIEKVKAIKYRQHKNLKPPVSIEAAVALNRIRKNNYQRPLNSAQINVINSCIGKEIEVIPKNGLWGVQESFKSNLSDLAKITLNIENIHVDYGHGNKRFLQVLNDVDESGVTSIQYRVFDSYPDGLPKQLDFSSNEFRNMTLKEIFEFYLNTYDWLFHEVDLSYDWNKQAMSVNFRNGQVNNLELIFQGKTLLCNSQYDKENAEGECACFN